MKVCIIQPAYSTDYAASDDYFARELALMRECQEPLDLIVMPEMCTIPCLAPTKEQADASSARFHDRFMQEAAEMARRCHAIVFANARYHAEGGDRNTTYAWNREGEIVGTYFKQHLTPGEVSKIKLDSDYTFEYSEPTVMEIEGLRFGFLICYDFYFYEIFPAMARQNLDIIIGCSHQRSDTHDALALMSQFLAYNTNAYVVRSSVSMGEDSPTGGASMVVAPDGKMLCNMKSRVGREIVEIDVSQKYYKPAGFGNPPSAHYEYVEKGRRPWKYRPAGSAIVRHNAIMPYPRVCAHRGFHTIAPENSMAAFGAAVAMGAEEIEFDLWATRDGEIVSIHDRTLDRVSNGTGYVYDHTYEELLALDFGSKYAETFRGLKILKFEEILKKFSCHVIMNIHIKTKEKTGELPEEQLQKIIDLVRKYDCEKYVYFMCGNDDVLDQLARLAPDLLRCCGAGAHPWEIVDRAIAHGCAKVQLFKPYFNQEMIDRAHANGILCNVFWSDDEEETKRFLDMGIDTILTNDYHRIAKVVRKRKEKQT